MKFKYKQAQESLTSTKVIGIILLVLVILTMLMFLMKPDFLDWIKNLPGYESPPDQTIDQSGIPSDQLTAGCAVQIALIGSEDISHWYNRGVDLRSLSVFPSGKNEPVLTGVVVEIKDDPIWLLKIKTGLFQPDIIVGQISKGVLIISPSLITNYQSSEIKQYVSLEDLKLLDHAFLYTQTKLCKPQTAA